MDISTATEVPLFILTHSVHQREACSTAIEQQRPETVTNLWALFTCSMWRFPCSRIRFCFSRHLRKKKCSFCTAFDFQKLHTM